MVFLKQFQNPNFYSPFRFLILRLFLKAMQQIQTCFFPGGTFDNSYLSLYLRAPTFDVPKSKEKFKHKYKLIYFGLKISCSHQKDERKLMKTFVLVPIVQIVLSTSKTIFFFCNAKEYLKRSRPFLNKETFDRTVLSQDAKFPGT